MNLIEIKSNGLTVKGSGLNCLRKGQKILANLTFNASEGQFLAFTGYNGVGKTTLLKVLAGMGEFTEGTLSIPLDYCIYLGHENGIKSELTVEENIRFWMRLYGKSTSSKYMSILGVNNILNRQLRHISSGQRRRVALASAILTGQKIWILDEPTTGLDEGSIAEFSNLADSHCKSGGIVIVTTHLPLKSWICSYLDLSKYSCRPSNVPNQS